MSEQIKKTDVIEDGIFKSLIEDLERSEKALKDFDEQLIATAKRLKTEVPKSTEASISSMEKLAAIEKKLDADVEKKKQNQKQLSTLQKEKLKLDQQVERAVAQKILVRSKENKAIQELRLEKNKENKAIRDGIKAKEREKNAYLKLQDATRDYKNESKRLGAELLQLRDSGKQNTKEYRELAKTYNTVTKNAQRGDAQLKKLDQTVGDNFRKVGAYENATRKLSSALGALGIAFGISTVVRSVTSVIKDYDQAVTDLGAITQKTAEELKPLNDQARALGESTQFSATEITQLQIELAKLGFTVQEIADSTGGIANFAAATGVEIPRAAALAGSSLRAFNLEATEIDRVVSTLGVATTKTALDFSQLENGLSTIAPVAASFGFSIEDTTALLGQLSNAGFDASSSATATRNILLNLADANGALAKELGRPIKSADDLAAGLQELQAKGVDLASALELTDKRSVAAFSTFISGSGSLVELRDSITDVNEELTKMAEDRLDSVSGAMKLLESAWEGFILNLNESVGASEAFQTAIKFIADNLSTIVKWIGRAVIAFATYKTAVMLVNVQQKIMDKGLKNIIKGFFSLKKGADDGSSSVGKLGRALKAIGWTALIAGAMALAKAFYDIASGAARATYEAELLERANQRIGKASTARLDEISKGLDEQLNANRKLLELGEITEDQAKKRSNQIISNSQKQLEAEKQLLQGRLNAEKQLQGVIQKSIKDVEDRYGVSSEWVRKNTSDVANYLGITLEEATGVKDIFNTFSESEANVKALTASLEALSSEESKVASRAGDINHEFEVSKKAHQTDGVNKLTEALERQKITLQEIDDLINSGRYQEEIDKERDDSEISDLTGALERENKERLTLINDFERNKKITEDEANEQRIIAEIDHLQRMKKLYELYGRDVTDINLQISAAQLNLSKEAKTEIEGVQESIFNSITNQVNETSKVLKSMLEESIDRAIEAENRLMDNSQKMIDSLRQAATEGNLQAKEFILAEEKAIEESQKRIAKHQRDKQRMEFISTGINTFNSSVQSGKTGLQALGETAVTMSGLAGMLAGLLPSFDVGADSLSGGGRGVDGKGGFLAINHPKERIFTANHNKRIGFDMRNDDIVDVVDFYKKGLLVPRDEVAVVSQQVDNTAILERIDKGFSKINNWNMSVDELFGTISVMVENSQNGNIHRYRRNYKA